MVGDEGREAAQRVGGVAQVRRRRIDVVLRPVPALRDDTAVGDAARRRRLDAHDRHGRSVSGPRQPPDEGVRDAIAGDVRRPADGVHQRALSEGTDVRQGAAEAGGYSRSQRDAHAHADAHEGGRIGAARRRDFRHVVVITKNINFFDTRSCV